MPETRLDGYFVFEWENGATGQYRGPLTKRTLHEYLSRKDAGTYQVVEVKHVHEVKILTDVREESWEDI